jgi:hypothetical protein
MRIIFGIILGCVGVVSVAAQVSNMGDLAALTRQQPGSAQRASSSNADLNSNGDMLPMAPGETLTLLDVNGPGVVTHFWNTMAAFDPFYGRSVVLRIFYDGNEKPSVQSPIGDFFGVGHGVSKNFTSLPVSTSSAGLSRTCYWHMPFRDRIKVTVTNESPLYPVPSFYYYLDWRKLDDLPEDTVYFHAEYRQAMPAPPGHYTILATKGRGHYAGTVYSVQQVEIGWFGEGDDFIYIDGEELPRLRGTGTEDYFNDAWGFREFNTPYHGVSLYEGVFASDRLTAYRWHIADPIPFDESIHVTIEHRGSIVDETAGAGADSIGSSMERPDWVSSVAFWYQYPPVTIDAPLPPAEQRIAPYRIIPVATLTHEATPEGKTMPAHVGTTYYSSAEDASIAFNFDVEKPGRYRISGLFEDTQLGAIWQPCLDGEAIGLPIDMVVTESQFVVHDFDLHDLSAGTHTLKFVQTGERSPKKRAIDFGETRFSMEYLILLRLEDMEGYHQLYNELKAKQKN